MAMQAFNLCSTRFLVGPGNDIIPPWKVRQQLFPITSMPSASDRPRVKLGGRQRLGCTLSTPVRARNAPVRPLCLALSMDKATLVPMAIRTRKSLREPGLRPPGGTSITYGPVSHCTLWRSQAAEGRVTCATTDGLVVGQNHAPWSSMHSGPRATILPLAP
jgi:hypothetical protein